MWEPTSSQAAVWLWWLCSQASRVLWTLGKSAKSRKMATKNFRMPQIYALSFSDEGLWASCSRA
jgi:hypothetical protein